MKFLLQKYNQCIQLLGWTGAIIVGWKICLTSKKNCDLWLLYDKVSKGKLIEWIWVKGHNGDKYNEIVDMLAKNEAYKYKT